MSLPGFRAVGAEHHEAVTYKLGTLGVDKYLKEGCRRVLTRIDDRSTRTVPASADELTPTPANAASRYRFYAAGRPSAVDAVVDTHQQVVNLPRPCFVLGYASGV